MIASSRSFELGNQVVVFLPSDSSKHLAKWMGPNPVMRKLSDATYEILKQDKRKQRHVFNVNMLAKW